MHNPRPENLRLGLILAAILSLLGPAQITSRAEAFDDAMLKETQSPEEAKLSTVRVSVSSPVALSEPPVVYLNEYACEAERTDSGDPGAYEAMFFVPEGRYEAKVMLSSKDSANLSQNEPLFINVSEKSEETEAAILLSYILKGEDGSTSSFLMPDDPAGKLVINATSYVPGIVTVILRSDEEGVAYKAETGENAPSVLLLPEGNYSILRIDSPKGASFAPEGGITSIRIESGRTSVVTLRNSTGYDSQALTESSEPGKASFPRNFLIGIVAAVNIIGALLLSAGFFASKIKKS